MAIKKPESLKEALCLQDNALNLLYALLCRQQAKDFPPCLHPLHELLTRFAEDVRHCDTNRFPPDKEFLVAVESALDSIKDQKGQSLTPALPPVMQQALMMASEQFFAARLYIKDDEKFRETAKEIPKRYKPNADDFTRSSILRKGPRPCELFLKTDKSHAARDYASGLQMINAALIKLSWEQNPPAVQSALYASQPYMQTGSTQLYKPHIPGSDEIDAMLGVMGALSALRQDQFSDQKNFARLHVGLGLFEAAAEKLLADHHKDKNFQQRVRKAAGTTRPNNPRLS